MRCARVFLAAAVVAAAAALAPRAGAEGEVPEVTVVAVRLPAATVGTPYAARITIDDPGAIWRYRARRRDLPRGLRLDRDGTLSGTPSEAGELTFPVRMKRKGRPRLELAPLLALTVREPSAWVELGTDPRPAARWGHAAALDRRRGRMLVFGGGSGVNWLADTHALDLATGAWSDPVTGGETPPPRWGHSLVVDSAGDRALLFGGLSVGPFGDVWALDLSAGTWTELAPAGEGPEPRRSHVAVLDPATRRMLVFGGTGAAGDLNDVWALELAGPGAPRWVEVHPAGTAPTPRSFAAGALDAERGRLYVFGGADATGPRGDVHVLDLAAPGGPAWSELSPTGGGPGPRTSPVVAFDDATDRLLVFGGDSGGTLEGDLWALDLSGPAAPAWTRIADADSAGPGTRASAAGAIDPAGPRLVVTMGNDGSLTDDAWALALPAGAAPAPAWSEVAPEAGPTARMNHTLVADPARGRLVLFGGYDGAYLDDAWSLDPGAPGGPAFAALVPEGDAPPRRFAHAAVLDRARDRMLVVAGSDGTSGGFDYFSDVWALDLSAPAGVARWSEIVPAGPGPAPRDEHVAVLDAANDRVLVFGGFDDVTVFDDLWALELSPPGGERWVPLSPAGDAPAGRAGASAVYDPVGRRMLLFGGGDGTSFLDDLWSLDLASPGAERWTRLDLPDGPAGRSLATMVLDPAGPSAVLAGGQALSPFDDAWRLVLGPSPRWERLPDVAPRSSAAGDYDAATRAVVIHGGLGPNLRDELLLLTR